MKTEINKGIFWGFGVGTGLSVILLIWIIGTYIYENLGGIKIQETEWTTLENHGVEIEQYTHRYIDTEYKKSLVISGAFGGNYAALKEKYNLEIHTDATIYNADGIFLQRCEEDRWGYYPEAHGFLLECENVIEENGMASINFLMIVKTSEKTE